MYRYNGIGHGMGNEICSMGHGFGPHMAIGAGVILAVIIFAAIIIVKKHKNSGSNDAVEMLKTLYVKGEISEEEFTKRKTVLKQK